MTDTFPRQQARTRNFSLGRAALVPDLAGRPQGCVLAQQRRQRPGDLPVGDRLPSAAWRPRPAPSGWWWTLWPSAPGRTSRRRSGRAGNGPGSGRRRGRVRHRRRVHDGARSRWQARSTPSSSRPAAKARGRRRCLARHRPATRSVRPADRLRLRGCAADHRPGDRPGQRADRAWRDERGRSRLRPGRVRRGRGNGPDAWLLVGARRVGPAGRAGRRLGLEPLAHRRPGQPWQRASHSRIPGGRHPERRGRAADRRPGRRQRRGAVGYRRVSLPH